MLLDQSFLDELTAQAQSNPRLRQAFDLRTTSEEQSQCILNALDSGTQIPVGHLHPLECLDSEFKVKDSA